MKVKLVVKDGGLVTYTEMPPFNPLPKGIVWGSRIFYLTDRYDLEKKENEVTVIVPIYEEDILWVDPSQLP